jgi:hypothetical protein
MSDIARLYTFTAGTKAMPDQVNAEFDQVCVFVNDLIAKELAMRAEGGAALIGAVPVIVNGAAAVQGILDYLEDNKVTSADVKAIRLNIDNVIETTINGTDWFATGSSGHLIIDSAGNELAQRSRLKFTNSTVTDNGTETLVAGLTGATGATGPQGSMGNQGPQGIQGEKGNSIIPSVDGTTGLMSFTEGPAGAIPSSVYVKGPQGIQGVQGSQGPAGVQGNQGVAGVAGQVGVQGPLGHQGPEGEAGANGTSFVVLGLYANLVALQTAHPVGNAGDAYAVGIATNNVIYNWDVATAGWVNLGSLQGPQGPQGIQGVQGNQGTAGVAGVDGEAGPNLVAATTSTNITGLLKGTGTLVAQATAGTDFVTPTGTETLTQKTLTSPKINSTNIVTATSEELNIMDGVTSTTAELNLLDGVLATTAELNFIDGVTSAIQTQLNSVIIPTITAVTGSKTLALVDGNTVQKSTSATAITITIPTNAAVAFPIGATIAFMRYGAGTVTFAGAGVTINAEDAKRTINKQYGTACLEKLATDEWALFGSLAT